MIDVRRRLGTLVAAITLIAGPAAAQEIGAVLDLDPAAYGTPPASAPTELARGTGVVSNELIQTLAGAATRIRFVDDSDLRLGQSSMIVLDRLVYDPDQGTKEFVLGIAVGAARFVSGEVDPAQFSIQTPVALIGIRGTDFVVLVEESGRTIVLVLEGAVVVIPRAGVAVVAVAGQTVIVEPGREAIIVAGLTLPRDPGLGLDEEEAGQPGGDDLARKRVIPDVPTAATAIVPRPPTSSSSPSPGYCTTGP